MAIPPLSALPIIGKLFKTDQTQTTGPAKAQSSQPASDVVEISDAARTQSSQTKDLSETEAQDASSSVRKELADDNSLVLGLQSGFE